MRGMKCSHRTGAALKVSISVSRGSISSRAPSSENAWKESSSMQPLGPTSTGVLAKFVCLLIDSRRKQKQIYNIYYIFYILNLLHIYMISYIICGVLMLPPWYGHVMSPVLFRQVVVYFSFHIVLLGLGKPQ